MYFFHVSPFLRLEGAIVRDALRAPSDPLRSVEVITDPRNPFGVKVGGESSCRQKGTFGRNPSFCEEAHSRNGYQVRSARLPPSMAFHGLP